MTNIQKLAVEIFQTPTKQELLQRSKMSKVEFAEWLKSRFTLDNTLRGKLLSMFSDGVFVINEQQNRTLYDEIYQEYLFLPKSNIGIMYDSSSAFQDYVNVLEVKYGKTNMIAIGVNHVEMFLLPSNSSFILTANIQKLAEEIFKAPTKDVLLQRALDLEQFTKNSDGTYDSKSNVNIINKHLIENGKLLIKFGRINGDFDCSWSGLTSLEGVPNIVLGDFDCHENYLTSLEGSPKSVSGSFYCSHNNLISLEGTLKIILGDFNCSFNELESLEGAPKIVKGNFHCFDNNLTSLEGAPNTVGGNFDCESNLHEFTEADVRSVCDVKGKIYV